MNVNDFYENKKQKTDKSFAFLIERCSRSEENPYGIKLSHVDFKRTTVVLLPGTADDGSVLYWCNGFLKKLSECVFQFLHFEQKDVQVCAAVNHFGKFFNPDMARKLLYSFYLDYHSYTEQIHNFDQSEICEYTVPNYVVDLYEQIVLPRLCDEKDHFFPFEKALHNMQKLIVVCYCHGAYTWMKIEEHLNLLLMGSKYSSRQKRRLLKSVTVLAYSPDCPLGFSETQFISIASASDLTIQHGNGFVRYVHRGFFVEDFGLSYLAGNWGKVFYCAQYSRSGVEGNPRIVKRIDPETWWQEREKKQPEKPKEDVYINEHAFLGFTPYINMSKAAINLQKIGIFILMTAIENSLEDKPKNLSVFSLVGGIRYNFWTCFLAAMKGYFIMLKYYHWARKPNRYSFADNVRFVSMD